MTGIEKGDLLIQVYIYTLLMEIILSGSFMVGLWCLMPLSNKQPSNLFIGRIEQI
jgi:hypothetical protein